METSIAEQLELFNPARLPRRPYCSEDLTDGLRIRSLKQALDKPYIQANPPHLRIWSIYDIDRKGGAIAWEDADLPPPNWAAANRENGHAHLVWGLSAPVLVDAPDARRAPMAYLAAVESAFRSKLDADQGYSGLITKNPVHPLWRVLKGRNDAYDLGELAEWVDLPKHLPKRHKPAEIGLGRNVTVFDWLRRVAYRQIRHYKGESSLMEWKAYLNCRALERNGDFMTPMDGQEVWHIAKSIAKWTWQRFDIAASDARFAALQSHRGTKGMKSRWGDNEDKRASARLMVAAGKTLKATAEELRVSVRTVQRWTA